MRIKYAEVKQGYVDLPADCRVLTAHLYEESVRIVYVDNGTDMCRIQVQVLVYGDHMPVGFAFLATVLWRDHRQVFICIEENR